VIQSTPLARSDAYLVAGAYAVLVVSMWAWYGLHSGMGYETHFVFGSERHPGLKSFIHPDPLRPFTSLFYHLSYVIGKLSGFAGSYVPYQLVYATLWLARGLLVFALVRMLTMSEPAAFLAGAFTILHASDGALNWVGQLNQFGFIFWMLLSFFFLLKAIAAASAVRQLLLLVAAEASVYMCLFSYESPLPIVLAFPILAISLFDTWSKRKALMLAAYYLVPAFYILKSAYTYLRRSHQQGYQISVLRHDWSPAALVHDWLVNSYESIALWRWPKRFEHIAGYDSHGVVVFTFAFVAVVIVVGIFVHFRRKQVSAMPSREAAKLILLGVTLIILSFPVYVLLDNAVNLWRTQMLSGSAVGIAFAGLAALAKPNRPIFAGIGLLVAASFAIQGVRSAQNEALFHRIIWEKHRSIVAGILRVAPQVRAEAFFILVNRGPEPLIFGHNLWFDMALRVAYPDQRVAGVYYDAPGKIAPGVQLHLDQSRLVVETPFAMIVASTKVENILALEVNRDRTVSLLPRLPDWLPGYAGQDSNYVPDSVILPGKPDDRAMRRYGPLDPGMAFPLQ
jgi:hypothetical protein